MKSDTAMREALEAINSIDTRGLRRILCELVETDIFDGGLINKTISAVEKARRAISALSHNNAAAMRDAILNIQEYAAAMDVDDGNVLAILDSCRDALSAPARNCDIHTDFNNAITTLASKRNWHDGKWDSERYCILASWLLAPAAEGKDKVMEGNQKQMREALIAMLDYAERKIGSSCNAHLLSEYGWFAQKADAALSAPPRNCDVGTAEEQEKRFYEKFCVKSCLTCPLSGLKRSRKADCIMTWAQMPYEAEEGGAK